MHYSSGREREFCHHSDRQRKAASAFHPALNHYDRSARHATTPIMRPTTSEARLRPIMTKPVLKKPVLRRGGFFVSMIFIIRSTSYGLFPDSSAFSIFSYLFWARWCLFMSTTSARTSGPPITRIKVAIILTESPIFFSFS